MHKKYVYAKFYGFKAGIKQRGNARNDGQAANGQFSML